MGFGAKAQASGSVMKTHAVYRDVYRGVNKTVFVVVIEAALSNRDSQRRAPCFASRVAGGRLAICVGGGILRLVLAHEPLGMTCLRIATS